MNGVAQAWGGTFKNGTFSYYVGVGKIKAGDRVTITAYDKAGKALGSYVKNPDIKVRTNLTFNLNYLI
ncbi:immunoglobulin-like domain-containing protein [Latilactobacillus curvatus]|uniref:immunoglobulin-like domain-containing protein n=1 Tax=Latilactobacillus curvatus TaxID=28038 RepID=UPI003BB050CA